MELFRLLVAITQDGATTPPKILSDYAASESESVSGALQVTMDSSRIAYTPRQDATPEGELNALSAVYKFILHRISDREEASEPALEPEGREDWKPSPTAGAPGCEGEA